MDLFAEIAQVTQAYKEANGLQVYIPTSIRKPVCQICKLGKEPSEMVEKIPAGTDVRAACRSCWNADDSWRGEEADRKRMEMR